MKEIIVKNLNYRAGNNQILNDLSLPFRPINL